MLKKFTFMCVMHTRARHRLCFSINHATLFLEHKIKDKWCPSILLGTRYAFYLFVMSWGQFGCECVLYNELWWAAEKHARILSFSLAILMPISRSQMGKSFALLDFGLRFFLGNPNWDARLFRQRYHAPTSTILLLMKWVLGWGMTRAFQIQKFFKYFKFVESG